MNLDVKAFKGELANYVYYETKLKHINEAILELDTKRGVHAVRFDKEPVQGSRDPLMISLSKLNDTDKSDALETNKARFTTRLNRINNFLNSTDYGESIKKIHCLQTSTYFIEARKANYSERQLKRIVNKEIYKFLVNVPEDIHIR